MTFFLSDTYSKIKNDLPFYVWSAVKKLIPIYLISIFFELFGLVIIFPVIKVVIDPSIIDENKYMKMLFVFFGFTNKMSFVLFLFSAITIVFIIKNLVLFIISKKQTSIAFTLASKLSSEKYSIYINKPYSFYNDNNTSVLLRNFVQLPFELVSYLIIPFTAIINEIFILTLIILTISIYDPILFWSLIIFTAPFMFIYNKIYKKKLKEISTKRDIESGNVYKSGQQSMEAFREITVFGKKKYFKSIFNQNLKSYSETNGEIYFLNTFSPRVVEIVAVIGIFSIFMIGYLFNKNIAVLAQFLIVFAIAAYRVIPSLNKIILCSNYIKSSSYILKYFSDKDIVKEDSFENNEPIIFQEKLELKNLCFSYQEKKDKVLKNINLVIKKGDTIGIVGVSGSGKSTLLNILLRLYEETQGGIYVDNEKICKKNIQAWYKLVAYVPQNVTILDGTIAENIAFGVSDTDIDYKLLKEVIEQSQLGDFIHTLSEGVNTQIGEKGTKISGGQRQRVGIARALYHGGKILIFDEATSALDTETEKELTESINNISHNEYTIIIVAHRVQTLIYCDKIYNLKEGVLELHENIPNQ